MDRRSFLSSVGLGVSASLSLKVDSAAAQAAPVAQAGRLKQGIASQGLLGGNKRSIEDRCKLAAALGIESFDFASDPAWWPVMKKYNLVGSCYRLVPAPAPGAPFPSAEGRPPDVPGWEAIGHKEAMGDYLKAVHTGIDVAATNGFPNLIMLAGF